MPERVEGPRFAVKTWREGDGWHASVTAIDPVAAPQPDDRRWTRDDNPAGADRIDLAVRRAVARFLDIHGDRCPCVDCDEKGAFSCAGQCACRGTARYLPRG